MEKHTAAPGEAWRLGEGPFTFRGAPPLCTGELELVNDSDEKVKVRAVPVVGHGDRAAAALGLGELRLGARLAPRSRARVAAHFLLDPQVPPGTYPAQLACADQREPVVVHVFERLDLRVEPGMIQLRGAGGDRLEAPVAVTNLGNVALTVPEAALVFLEERNWVGRSLVHALRETGEEEGHQAFLDRVVRELKASTTRPARVTVRGGGPRLAPGETSEVRLEIALPAELVKGRTYTGSARFMTGRLTFEVVCNGATGSTKRRPR